MSKVRILFQAIALCGALCVFSNCGSDSGKKAFNPQEKESTMTDAERAEAINAKKAASLQTDSALVFGNGIKLTIMKPKAEGALTENVCDLVKQRMLEMVTANGIGGIGGDPAMVFACGVSNVSKKLTGTAPQKTQVTLDLQYMVCNVASGTVFGSLTDEVIGVGDNEAQAYMDAARQIKNNHKIQQMLKSSHDQIISYYNNNASSIKAEVESLIAKNDYDRAYALLRGIPEQCSSLFEYSKPQLASIAQKMLVRDAVANLASMQSAIAANDKQYAEVVGDIMALIPVNTPQYAEAKAAFSKYMTDLEIKADKQAKIEAEKADAEHQRKMQMLTLDAKIAHQEAVDGRWDKGFALIGDGIKSVRDIGVTFGRNSSWTSFLNPSNLVSSVSDAMH